MHIAHSATAAPADQAIGKPAPDRLLRLPQVMEITGAGKSAIYKWMRDGAFPLALLIGTRCVAWRESEVLAWIDGRAMQKLSLPRQRRAPGGAASAADEVAQ